MNPNRTHRRTPVRPRVATIAPIAMLVVLALLAAGRLLPGTVTNDEPRTGAADARVHARERDAPPAFEPAAVTLPASWKVVDRSDGVTTWRSNAGDDSVSVAAVEAAATPLAAIVADVARQAQAAGPGTTVAAPRQLPSGRGPRQDAVMELALQTRVDGRHLYVRQVWRRDSRAGRDVVATWTSADDSWEVDPATTVPTMDLR